MALAPQTVNQGITVRAISGALLTTITVILYAFPKYIALGGGGVGISPYNLAVIASIFFGVIGLFGRNTRPILTGWGWLAVILFVVHFVARLFSDRFGLSPGVSLYLDIRELILIGGLFIVGITLGHWPNTLTRVATIISACMLIIGAICIIEIISGTLLSTTIITSLPLSIDENFKRGLLFDKSRDGAMRAQAIFYHPIVLGEISAASIPVILSQIANNRSVIVSVISILSCIACTILSGSRAAEIGMMAGLMAFFIFSIVLSRNPKTWITAFVTLPITFALLFAGYNYAIDLSTGRTEAEQLSSQVRQTMWERGNFAISDAPLIGHGAGSSVSLAGVKGRLGTLTIDDYYLTLLLDYGKLGILTLAGMLIAVVLGCVATKRSMSDRRSYAGYLAGICVIAICQRALSINEAIIYLMFFCGLLVANQSRTTEI